MQETALFAAGCFWGVQYYYDQIPGVLETEVGYSGGHTKNPTYEDVCYSDTGHAETLRVVYDPEKVSYETLVKQFLYMHDPTQVGGQGPDVGDQYRSAIFYTTPEQKIVAEGVLKASQKDYDMPITTEVTKASEFYPAEDYHQKFTHKTGRGACHRPYKQM